MKLIEAVALCAVTAVFCSGAYAAMVPCARIKQRSMALSRELSRDSFVVGGVRAACLSGGSDGLDERLLQFADVCQGLWLSESMSFSAEPGRLVVRWTNCGATKECVFAAGGGDGR